MNYRLEQLHKDLKKFSLKPSEKQEIRNALLSHIQANPLPTTKRVSKKSGHGAPVASPFYTTVTAVQKQLSTVIPQTSLAWYRFFRSSSYVTGLVVLSLVLGGGVSLAAENALPGETLYSVKTNINEGVQSLLAVSDESRASLQVKFAGRRLEEAEKLAVKGELSDSKKAQIEEALKTHTDNFKTQAKKLENSKKYTTVVAASSDFESTLKAHEGVLSALEDQNQNTTSVAAQVKVALNDVQASRLTIETKVKTDNVSNATTTADIASTSAKTIAATKDYINDNKNTIGFDSYIEAMARIALAETSYKEGTVKAEQKLYGDAFVSFQDAERLAKEARVALEATVSLNIDLKPGTGTTTATTTPPVACETDNDCSVGYSCTGTTTVPVVGTSTSATTTATTTQIQICKPGSSTGTTTATTTSSTTNALPLR